MSESESELESDDDEQGMTVVPTSKAKRGAGAGVGGGAGGGRSDTCNEAAILLKLEQLSTVKVPLRQGPSSSPDGSGRRCTPEGGRRTPRHCLGSRASRLLSRRFHTAFDHAGSSGAASTRTATTRRGSRHSTSRRPSRSRWTRSMRDSGSWPSTPRLWRPSSRRRRALTPAPFLTRAHHALTTRSPRAHHALTTRSPRLPPARTR